MCELGRRLGSQRGISVCIFNHESRAGCGDQEECWRRSSPTLPFHEDETQPTSDFKIKHLASLRQRTEFKSRILSVPLSFYFLFIYFFFTTTPCMPSIINPEEENPKFDIWSSDSIMFGKTELWNLSLMRQEKIYRDHLIWGVLKQGLMQRLQRVQKFPEITAKFYFCEHFSGEGGYIRFLMRSITPWRLKTIKSNYLSTLSALSRSYSLF